MALFKDRAARFRQDIERRLGAIGARLGQAMGLARPVSVEVLDADEVNAYARGETIHVTLGMIRLVRNEDELALVVGHELGHVVADQQVRTGGMSPEDRERLADYYALVALHRAGYDIKAACELWQRMATELARGQAVVVPSHPSYAERYVRAHKVAESLLSGVLAAEAAADEAASVTAPTATEAFR